MHVLKFGGTSVGSVKNMNNVKNIINDGRPKVIVLSAMSGTTNALLTYVDYIRYKELESAQELLSELYHKYRTTSMELLGPGPQQSKALEYLDVVFGKLKLAQNQPITAERANEMVAQGELLSTFLFNEYLREQDINSHLLPALEFMRVDKAGEPDMFYIRQNLERCLSQQPNAVLYITQGFICLDAEGNISNLSRGGSDYTATILGAALKAEEVQIWTDIDGFHNNDPRIVPDTHAIAHLSFDEAAELAYFGAKILHPQTVTPVRELNIPVRLKNTMDPSCQGTVITNHEEGEGIKAIAAKDGITAIKIKSARMLQAHGFLKRVFDIFEKYETSIDMITTSEIAVSLTIDDSKNLNSIVSELEKFSSVEVEGYRTIVCLVGHHIVFHPDTARLFQILQDVNVRMISYGGSSNNISLLINTSDKTETLRKLNRYVFDLVPAVL